jgi:hypothetical protein
LSIARGRPHHPAAHVHPASILFGSIFLVARTGSLSAVYSTCNRCASEHVSLFVKVLEYLAPDIGVSENVSWISVKSSNKKMRRGKNLFPLIGEIF